MGPGPESISSNQSMPNPIVSQQSSQNEQVTADSKTQAATQAEGASSTKSTSVSRWNFLSAARNALVALRDAIVNKLSGLTSSSLGVEASASSSAVTRTPAADYDDAKADFDAAKTGLQDATTLADYEKNMTELKAALQDMERLAGSDQTHQTEIENIKQALQDKQEVINKLDKLVTLQNQNLSLIEALKTTDSAGQIPAIGSQFEANLNEAENVIKELQAGNISNYDGVLSNAEEVIKNSSESGLKLSNALQTIVDAGDQSQAAVLQAQQNNSPDNIAASKEIIEASKEKVEELKQENSELTSSPLVSKAEGQIAQAQQDIEDIKPSGSDIPIVGPSGSAASAGSAAGALKTSGRSDRISLLLDDADNEMASIAMQGFRSMIEQFNVNNPATAKELEAMNAELTAMTEQMEGPNGELPAEIQAIKDALAQALKQPSADGLATTLGQIAFAAARTGGGSAGAAGTIQANVKQLYKTAFSSTSSSSYASALADGYSAYQSLNSVYSESRSGLQSAISQTANPALSRTLSRSGIESQGRSADASRRAAETIVRDSRTLGDVYSRLQVLDSLMGTIANNPQANQQEIMQKLTASITKAPQFGYPAVQNSTDSLQKFAAKLEQEFINGERDLAESKENAFRRQPAFIQQVLVNIASIFSNYLS